MKKSFFNKIILWSIFCLLSTYINAQSFNNKINNVVQEISEDSIKSYINFLQAYETRFLLNQNRLEIAIWLQNKLISFGFENARIDTFLCHIVHPSGLDTSLNEYNVVATFEGMSFNNETIVYGAHYDSFSTDTNPLITAPGADDNASGTAAVLETARVIKSSNFSIPQTIEFVLFGAEEYMNSCNSGSEYHALQAKLNSRNIVFMINNDMVSFNDGNNKICFSNYPSCHFATNLAIFACQNYSSLNYQLWPISWTPFADAEPFYNIGAQTVYMEESYFNPFYHTSNDSTVNIDFNYCAEVAKISCASILSYNFATKIDEPVASRYITIFPNPTSKYINIILPNNELLKEIYIYNITGRLSYFNEAVEYYSIDVSDLTMGIYFIKLFSTRNIYYSRFFKK